MPNYTLYYFNGRGRAEICRMMFAAAGVKYTDKRFEFSEWDRYRKDFPCGYLPCLEMDGGFRMPETMSICRYIARQYGFYPKSPMDMFRCEYICDCFYEIMHDYMRYYHWKNGRFRYDFMDNGMMGSNMTSGMMGSNMNPGMMGSNMSSGMMGSNMNPGMMGSNMSSGMMGSNMNPGMMGSNMSSGMMGSNMNPGMMGSNMSSGMMGSNMTSGMMTSNMNPGMMGSNMSSGMGMGSGDMMSRNYDDYMQWRYMNSFNRIMPFMERTLSMRNGGSHFFMGDQMLWCDMMFYCCMENMYMQNQSMFSSYPKLMALYKRVAAHPKICSYLKNRCRTNW